MKATGIIRRIDELGRIVIPKEIRKKLKINEGENIEIYIDEDEKIILKKYSNIKNITDLAQKLTDSIYSFIKNNVIITDNNTIIAVTGNLKKDLLNKELTNDVIDIMKKRTNILETKNINITNDISVNKNYLLNTIISNGDINGSIIFIKDEGEIKEIEKQLVNMSTSFLSKYLEE
ncbi:MAG: AbrB/MazE/SpoVT family DNA-binding domain-containing protein [Bacilli bacterium]|nr:AbrB/MazE/SpoVT family DNA-binding domain-containing protein [Bacilli bacterium]